MNNILKVNLDDIDNDKYININNNINNKNNEQKEKISSKVKTKLEDIIFLSSTILKKVNLENIFKLYSSDYCIFLTNKFFKNNIVCFNFKKSLLEYFDKYEVAYLNYYEKNNIINIINIINNFIQNSDEKEKEKFLFDINLRFKLNLKKIKVIFFNENIVEPDILFKKIQFSNQEVYIIFNNYIIKKTEYKLRIFCQIAEKLGAEKIIINYYSFENKKNNLNLNLDLISSSVGVLKTKNELNEDLIRIEFEYPERHSFINLNKYHIINSILDEHEFLITKEEFESDLELKFLIDARCLNFIQKYHTNFIINNLNKIEEKIFLKANNYGLNIGNSFNNNKSVKFNITINFLNIFENLNLIDGTNLHIMKEGFNYLVQILNRENNYLILLRYLESHFYALNKKWIKLNYDFDNINVINKIYRNIIILNFDEEEIGNILKSFFKNNLTWTNFKKFRDIILKGSDYGTDKLYFVTFQYHEIMNNKKNIMINLEKIINNSIKKYIENINFASISNLISNSHNNINKIKIIESYDDFDNRSPILLNISNIDIQKLEESINTNIYNNNNNNNNNNQFTEENFTLILNFLNRNFKNIYTIISNTLKKSFKFNGGLSDNLTNIDKLNSIFKNIINYYFDKDIQKIQIEFDNEFNFNFDFKYNLKKLFDDLIKIIILEIIKSNGIYVADYSPNAYSIKDNKISLFQRIQKIFIKFLIKYCEFENRKDILQKIEYLKDDENNDEINSFINKFISINKVYKNYNKNKLFYTWDDFLFIIKNINL